MCVTMRASSGIVCALLVAAVCAPPVAAADLTLRQHTTLGDSTNGFDSTEYWSGTKRATDLADARVVVDLEAQTITVLDKGKKTYTVRQPAGAAPGAAAGDSPSATPPARKPVRVTPTGKSDSVAGFKCTEWIFTGDQVRGALWVTEAFDEPLSVRYARLMGHAESPESALASAIEQVKGVPLRTILIVDAPSGTRKTTTEVVQLSAGVPGDVFAIPPDYRAELKATK
jgi:hypothetical protein